MLGQLISPLTKGLLLVAFLATSVAVSTTYLYLGARDKLSSLESQHTQLKQELKECSEGKSRVVEGAKQDDTINVDKEDKISTLESEKDVLLKKLRDLSKPKKCSTPTTNTPESPPNETIDISASWDADVQQLLNNAYRSNKRDSNPTP